MIAAVMLPATRAPAIPAIKGTERKIPAYAGAVLLCHGARFSAGFGFADAM